MTTSGITNINAKLIHQHPDNPRKDLGDLTDACPKNITVEEYLATFPKIKLTRREYLQTIPLYHAALYLAETTQKVHSSQDWYLYLNEKVDQSGEVLIGEYDVSKTDKTEET